MAAAAAFGIGTCSVLFADVGTADAVTGANTRISYVRNGSLYLANADGSSPLMLVDGGVTGTPRWFADGSQVLYIQNGDVYIASANGTVLQRMTTDGQATDTFLDDDNPGYEDAGTYYDVDTLAGLSGSPMGFLAGAPVSDAGLGMLNGFYLDSSGYLIPQVGTTSPADVQMIDPEFSPDESKIAYIDPATGSLTVRTIDISSTVSNQYDLGAPRRVTADSGADSGPQWSPDGTSLTYESGGNVLVVGSSATATAGTKVVTGASGAVPVDLTAKYVVREWGSNALETAIAVSQRNYQTAHESNSGSDKRQIASCVVLSRSDVFYDALTGSALARQQHCPLLLVPHTGA